MTFRGWKVETNSFNLSLTVDINIPPITLLILYISLSQKYKNQGHISVKRPTFDWYLKTYRKCFLNNLLETTKA